jgi:SAM-dependent methyltransferase
MPYNMPILNQMTCPACGATERTARPLFAALTVRRCVTCGLLTSEIRTAGAVSYNDVDDTLYEAAIGMLRRRQAIDVLRFVQPHATNGGVWLDIGCGPGYLLAEARAAGFPIRGIEPDAKAAALARARLGEDAVRHDIFRGADDADIVSTLDVLEHVPVAELANFASRVRQSLRSGGVWAIKVPSTEGLFFRVAHALRLRRQLVRLWQSEYAWPHTVYFDRATLTSFLGRNGFDVVSHRYLAEVPLATAKARLTMMKDVPRWQALLGLPAIAAVNLIETLRRKSDALVVLARPQAGR